MNIIFFGSSHFSVPSLRSLLNSGHTVSCIVTQPDRKQGRGMHVGVTALKEEVRSLGIRFCQPEDVNSADSCSMFKDISPDVFVVIAYGQKLSRALLDVPRIFAVNVHASLLPAFRGAAPINRALINGEKNTGVTVIKMSEKMDAGPVILRKELEILYDDTYETLEGRLSHAGAEALLEALEAIESEKFRLMPQDPAAVTLAPKLRKEDGLIDWNKSSREIYNLVRGVRRWPGAYTHYHGKLLKIHEVSEAGVSSQGYRPGEITGISKEGIQVSTGNGLLLILLLQPEGKRPMKASEFISGHRTQTGELFG